MVDFLLEFEERNIGIKSDVIYPKSFDEYFKRYKYLERFGDS